MSQPKKSQKERQPNLFRVTLSPTNAEWVREEMDRLGFGSMREGQSAYFNYLVSMARAGSTLPTPPPATTQQPADASDDMFTFDASKL